MADPQGFAWRRSKDGALEVSWQGRPATTLRGPAADRLETKLRGADERGIQMLLARATGNFKRGNEREGKLKGR